MIEYITIFFGTMANVFLGIFNNNFLLTFLALLIIYQMMSRLITNIYNTSLKKTKLMKKGKTIWRTLGKTIKIGKDLNIPAELRSNAIADCYKKNGCKTTHFLILPSAMFLLGIITIGFMFIPLIQTISMPLTYILKLPTETIANVVKMSSGGTQLAVFAEFDLIKEKIIGTVSPEIFEQLNVFYNGMLFKGINLAKIPNVQHLTSVVIFAVSMGLLSLGLRLLYSYLFNKKLTAFSVMYIFFFLLSLMTAFTLPTMFCIPWGLLEISRMVQQTYNFSKKYKRKTVDKRT